MSVTNVRAHTADDPFLAFRFLVSWGPPGGTMTPAAYVSKISALSRTAEVVTWREGGAPQSARKMQGQTTCGEIILQRGLTLDNNFEDWASKVAFYPDANAPGANLSGDFRKDIKIELRNQAGQVVTTYQVFKCWPSSCTTLPELDTSADGVAIESMTLQHEGWSRDDTVKAPAAMTLPENSHSIPSFDRPS